VCLVLLDGFLEIRATVKKDVAITVTFPHSVKGQSLNNTIKGIWIVNAPIEVTMETTILVSK